MAVPLMTAEPALLPVQAAPAFPPVAAGEGSCPSTDQWSYMVFAMSLIIFYLNNVFKGLTWQPHVVKIEK